MLLLIRKAGVRGSRTTRQALNRKRTTRPKTRAATGMSLRIWCQHSQPPHQKTEQDQNSISIVSLLVCAIHPAHGKHGKGFIKVSTKCAHDLSILTLSDMAVFHNIIATLNTKICRKFKTFCMYHFKLFVPCLACRSLTSIEKLIVRRFGRMEAEAGIKGILTDKAKEEIAAAEAELKVRLHEHSFNLCDLLYWRIGHKSVPDHRCVVSALHDYLQLLYSPAACFSSLFPALSFAAFQSTT